MYHFKLNAGSTLIGKIRTMICVWKSLNRLHEEEPKILLISKDRPLDNKYRVTLTKGKINT